MIIHHHTVITFCPYRFVLFACTYSVVRSAVVLLQGPRGFRVQQSGHVADNSVQSEMRKSVRLHETKARVQVIAIIIPYECCYLSRANLRVSTSRGRNRVLRFVFRTER